MFCIVYSCMLLIVLFYLFYNGKHLFLKTNHILNKIIVFELLAVSIVESGICKCICFLVVEQTTVLVID